MALMVALVGLSAGQARADVTTMSTDLLRTGWDSHEPGLGPTSVQASDFGQLFSTQLDGQVYAQPLSVNGTLIASTENDKTYGLDPATGAVRWTRDFGPTWPSSAINCGDLAPNVGTTGTPVYDPASNAVYLTTKVNDGADVQHPHWYMHALDPATGAEKTGWPVTIQGAPSNDPTMPFDAFHEMQRPGLLLMGGVVYAAFGGHCDMAPYRGYVVGVSTTTPGITAMWASETGASNSGAGIWQAGGALMSDGPGRIFLGTGNGISPPAGPGKTPPGVLAESVVRLQVNADRSLSAADFFSPANAPTLDQNDTDLASGGPVGLPDSFGTPSHPHLMVQQGKDGRVFLLDRDNLGGRSQGANGTDAVVGTTGPFQGQWGHPAVWGGDGGYVYLVGSNGPLRALKAGVTGDGTPALTAAGTSGDSFPYTSGSPVVTSDGTTSGSALVWAVWAGGPTGANATLRAYNPVPDANGNLSLVWSAPIGTAAKFAVPATDGNRVYIGTRDGKVYGFGRPARATLTAQSVELGQIGVGSTGTGTATLTATTATSITAITAAAPFGVTAPTLPINLTAGQQVSVPVSFTPTAAGGAGGALTVTTTAGSFLISLHGTGTKPGLGASPATVAFATQPTGTTASLNVQITNTGTAAETIGTAALPGAPFTVSGLPAAGTSVAPGASFVATVLYAPTAAGKNTDTLTLNSSSGSLAVPLTATAEAGVGHLTLSPATLDFGQVAVGSAKTVSFDITNDGNIPVTVTKAKAPNDAFTSSAPLAEGLVIGPDQVVHQSVTFTPTAPGAVTSNYQLTGDAGQGSMLQPLTGTGFGALPAPAASQWTNNGVATLPGGGALQLTGQTGPAAGSAFYRSAVATDGLTANFTTQLGPGTGGDGLAFVLADAGKSSANALGATGGGVGFSGIPGVAVVLDTWWNPALNSGNYVAVAVGPNSGTDSLTYLAGANVPGSLRTGTHQVAVQIVSGHLKVSIDGTQYLDTTPTLPATAFAGFTAGTGGAADVHAVSNVSISTASPGGPALTPGTPSLDFGTVPTGDTKGLTLTLTNKGTTTTTVTGVTAPATPFTATLPATGATVAPGAAVQVPVAFAPGAAGTQSGSLTVTTTGGATTVPITGTGTPIVPFGQQLPAPSDPSWVRNGSAALNGTDLVLTKAGAGGSTGTSFYPTAVPTSGLHATFTSEIGGGSGADGLTFALLDPAAATSSAVGNGGGALGFAGLPGVAVALNTYWTPAANSGNFVAVATSTAGAANPTYASVNGSVAALRTGTHTVTVDYTPVSHLVVQLDGTQVLDTAVQLQPNVLVGFTASTGGLDDNHIVRNVAITAGKAPMKALPAFGDASWSVNGTATLNGTSATLTAAGQASAAGTVINSTAVPSAGLHVTFNEQIGGGNGADGLALALFDSARVTAKSLGANGGSIGIGGLPATYVGFQTWPGADVNSYNYATIGTSGPANILLATKQSATNIAALRGSTHAVDVQVTAAGHLVVTLDGTQILDSAVQLPPTVLVGFGGGSGGMTDNHVVSGVTVRYNG
ncbi:choice-of-anchor D domain-containing protein [Streptomyces tateyamensis]|nr:choice-of-anchor D domain-containing protein [Streptomyces tateyamensis]